MRRLVLLLVLACGDDLREIDAGVPDAQVTEIFHVCEAGAECETGTCEHLDFNFDAGPSVCTVPCKTHADCAKYNINAFCLCNLTPDHICWVNAPEHGTTPRHCRLQCLPKGTREQCDLYGVFCPEDCEAQGLKCELTVLFPVLFTCTTPLE